MPQMERNLDLESVDSDTLFGIEALKHQSIGQKIIFYGCLLGGILANTAMPRFFHTPGVINVLTFTALLAIGITAGCNYTQDMSYGKYVFCMLFGKKKVLPYKSPEDLRHPERRQKTVEKKQDEKSQKKMAASALLMILALIAMLSGIYIWQGKKEAEGVHHEIREERRIYE